MTQEDALKLVKFAWAQWPHRNIDDFVVQAFWQPLADRDFGECWAATVACLKHDGRAYPPTTGEILREVKAARAREIASTKVLPEGDTREIDAIKVREIFEAAKVKNPHLFS